MDTASFDVEKLRMCSNLHIDEEKDFIAETDWVSLSHRPKIFRNCIKYIAFILDLTLFIKHKYIWLVLLVKPDPLFQSSMSNLL